MNYDERKASLEEGELLASIRVRSMKESLEAVGRFNPETARRRFLDSFVPNETTVLLVNAHIIGFYVLQEQSDNFYLAHLYILPEFQRFGLGAKVLRSIKELAAEKRLKVTVGALKESQSNAFYMKNGFNKTHEDEWDVYYEVLPLK